MPLPVIAAAANAGSVLAALNKAVIFVVSAISASAAMTEVGRRKKTASEAKAADQAARQNAADDFAKVGPFADALKKAMERAQEDDCSKRKECPALQGHAAPVNHAMSRAAADYQARITGFPHNVEWKFDGKDFDGFFPSLCQLVETKANYDQFFKKNSYVFIFPTFKGVSNALEQAKRQEKTIKKHPPTSLAWYFKTPLFHVRMTEEFAKYALSILTIFKP